MLTLRSVAPCCAQFALILRSFCAHFALLTSALLYPFAIIPTKTGSCLYSFELVVYGYLSYGIVKHITFHDFLKILKFIIFICYKQEATANQIS